jgi:hypothetical protein
MYQFSRALYRELAPLISPVACGSAHDAHAAVLTACERTVERMATDRHYFKHPVRTLFRDVRAQFPVSAQHRVWSICSTYVACIDDWLRQQPVQGAALTGLVAECRATTRRGTPCRRAPLLHNGYCPSHQHLAETEDAEALQLVA